MNSAAKIKADNTNISKGLTYKTQKRIWAAIFLAPWVIGFLTLFLLPLITSLNFSFNYVQVGEAKGLVTSWAGIANYRNALFEHTQNNIIFQEVLLGTLGDVLINIPVIIIFSLFIATLLNAEFKGRAIVRAIFFVPVILNSGAIAAALTSGDALTQVLMETNGNMSAVFNLEEYLIRAGVGTGLVNFIVSLISRIYSILSLAGVPILLFLASIQSIPRHLYEAAEIEGATKYEQLWLITLPNVTPHILTVAVYVLVDTYLTSEVSTYIANVSGQTNWGLSAAMSWIYVGVMLLVLALVVAVAKIFKWGEYHYA